jgi:tRNA1(Val) A37 N6-methylase TrmN6
MGKTQQQQQQQENNNKQQQQQQQQQQQRDLERVCRSCKILISEQGCLLACKLVTHHFDLGNEVGGISRNSGLLGCVRT